MVEIEDAQSISCLGWEQIRKETSTYARELLWKKTFDRRYGYSMDGMLRKVWVYLRRCVEHR